ncbi:MAG TPA: hypothetical protein VMG40_20690, partial [Bryobacteraceae bacterium]|nr:hypothetical protein [Bryobacteraceae bacterium]
MRATFLILFCLLAAVPAWPQAHPRAQAPGATHGQLDSSETLFTVMAAINAAGYDAEIDNPANSPVRKAVRDHLKSLNLPVVEELRRFVHAHKQTDPGADLSQYISYALVIDGPPDFGRHYANIVPPDVEDLEGLTPLIVRFYREANIAGLWKQVEPQYDEMIAGLSRPIARAVLQVNAYLRHDTAGYLGRNFQIYVDLMGAPNQVQTRSYGDQYTIVLTPSPEPRTFDVRHAYLHYLLDPLSTRYQEILDRKK